jgi:hypothetical protein
MPQIYEPDALLEAINSRINHEKITNFLVIEVSSDKYAILQLSYGDFRMLKFDKISEKYVNMTPQTVKDNVFPIMDAQFEKYEEIYLIGEYATDDEVQEAFAQKLERENIHALPPKRMPHPSAIQGYLALQSVPMPYDLVLVMLQMPDMSNREPRQERMAVVHEVLVGQGTPIQNHQILIRKDFQTSMLKTEHHFYVAQRTNGRTKAEGLRFDVTPLKDIFSLVIRFENGELTYEWGNARVAIATGERSGIPAEQSSCWVDIQFKRRKILFAVEATLGVKRKIPKIEEKDLVKVTNFEVVRQFIYRLATKLAEVLVDDSGYNVWFYHDPHNDLVFPHEFNKAGLESPSQTIEAVSDDFVPYDEFERLLEDNSYYGIRKPSLVKDWEKPLEVVAHELNRAKWCDEGLLVIWIGQSSPHLHKNPPPSEERDKEKERNKHLRKGGVHVDYDFNAEIRALHAKGAIQLAFFVDSDLPAKPETIGQDARQTWQTIATKPLEIYFRPIRLVDEGDASLEAEQFEGLGDTLENMKYVLRRVLVLRFMRGGGYADMWRIPIKDFEPNAQIIHE